jgi:Txe/YoeB family toxin of Txe-Axe toxin-antitoxin module
MSEYLAVYERRFVENLRSYAGMRERIKRRVERLLTNPYANTELLSDLSAKLNLRGCRSARVDRNFRIVFVICEECRLMTKCEYCFCDGLANNTIIFLTVGTHDVAYAMK